jgi:predicted enzyme related to lactoylglutathione lyase
MSNQIVWCDIPVANLDRAIKFYSTILGQPVAKETAPGMTFGLLSHSGEEVGACLVEMADQKPGPSGPIIYLNCEGRLDIAIAKVELNGGKILKPKHPIGPYGFRAVIQDSEGNHIALHSKKDSR